jgi:hypothetical protein
MTKKLFVVLVVVSAMLISFSLLMAAKAPIKGPATTYEKRTISNKQLDTSMPEARLTTHPTALPLLNKAPSEGPTVPKSPAGGACHLQWDNGNASGYFGGWAVGDKEAIYYDPAAVCTGCPLVYPFQLTQVTAAFYDFAAVPVGTLNVIIHIYAAGAQCDGPGIELFQFPATVTTFYPDEAVIPVPIDICLNGPFFLAVEYNSGTTGTIPSLLFDDQVADTCVNFNWYGGFSPPWYEWYDFWNPPVPGYLMLRADGTCNASACLGTPCDMFEGSGTPRSYWGNLAANDRIALYYDPEAYCTAPVYPVKLHDVYFLLYNFGGATSVDIQVAIYLKCQVPCDGPGSPLYLSPVYSVNTFYPNVLDIELPEVVCVYEPFFVAVQYVTGSTGSTPSVMFDNTVYTGGYVDDCYAWMWWESGGYPEWTEWHDFWTAPGPGFPMIYVGGFTESDACNPPPCDETLITLAGGTTAAAYYWRLPDAYGDDFFNERFEMPADRGGTLEKFDIAFYYKAQYGAPNPDFYVWLSDGTFPLDNNPPYQAIADFHINYSDIVWPPGLTTVQTYSHSIHFDASELFHIGYSHAHVSGDTLAVLSTNCAPASNRSSEWWGAWGTMQSDWSCGLDFLINAYICPGPVLAPFFSMKCTPALGYASPGDVGVNVYKIGLVGMLDYNLPVDLTLLSVTPSQDITASFDPPNPQTLPDTVAVAISVGSLVPYGDYTLVFQGVGTDNLTKTCSVTLTVRYPYDEGIVNFYHGWQRASNFGAVANGDLSNSSNFSWYGKTPLYDGSIISVTPVEPLEDHMALDLYSCEHVGFIPSQHMVITSTSFGEVAYSNFYTEEDVVSCEFDSVYVIGLSNVVSTDFSIKIKIYYDTTATPIPLLYPAVYEDWDVSTNGASDWAGMDTLHNMIYQWNSSKPDTVFGIMRLPMDDNLCYRMVSIYNPEEVYADGSTPFPCGETPGPSYLAQLVMNTTAPPELPYRYPGTVWGEGNDDHSVLIVSQPFSLDPGEKHIEAWIDFGRALNDGLTWEMWYKLRLRLVGFYRGDVNANDSLEAPQIDISDLVYLINYQFKDGPPPLPFTDQGDVNADRIVDLADVVYLIRFAYRGGPAPIDYLRFIPSLWTRPSLFTSPNWK